MRPLTPFEKRVTLLVRSRIRGMGWTIAAMSALALITWRTDGFVYWAGAMVAMFVAVPLVLAPVRSEIAGPGAALWLQKPVHELRFACARLGETMTASISLAVLSGCVALAYGNALGWEPPRPLGFVLPTGALTSFVTASVAFGTTAWLPRGSRAAVVGLIVLSLYVFRPEIVQPDIARGGLVAAAELVLFPTPNLLRVVLGMTGDIAWSVRPLLACLAYAATWIAVGMLGVWWSATFGRIARDA